MDSLTPAGTPPSKVTSDETTKGLTNDKGIRAALKEKLVAAFGNDPDTLILDELGLRHGATRVDLAVVNGCLHGFEVKSDRDTLRRLPRQVKIYSEILDYVTLVIGHRHALEANQKIPSWWGIQIAKQARDGEVRLHEVRPALENPNPDNMALAKLLWRDEAVKLLEELGAADGIRSKPRRVVYARLAEAMPLCELRSRVRHQLRSRKDWRSVGQRKLDGG